MTGASARVKALAALALLGAATVVLYGLTVNAPVIYDDDIYVRTNSVFLLGPKLFWNALWSLDYFGLTQERSYQPLVTLLHYPIHNTPALYRALGWALHSLNAALVMGLGLRLGFSSGQALRAGLLMALVPAATEAVNFSAFKGHLLAFGFTLLSLQCWIASRREGAPKQYRLFSVLAFSMALLSKESGVCGLLLIASYTWVFRAAHWKRDLNDAGGFLAAAAVYFPFRFLILRPAPPLEGGYAYYGILPPLDSLGWYLTALAKPFPLCLEQALVPGTGGWLLRWGAAAAFLVFLWFCRKRKEEFFLLLWIPLMLLPVLHFIPFANYSPVADRYLYGPAAGAVLWLAHIARGGIARVAIGALALVWGAVVIDRNIQYNSPGELYAHTARCAPNNPGAQGLLATWHYKAGDYNRALGVYRRVFDLEPDYEFRIPSPGLVHLQGRDYIFGLVDLRLNRQDGAAEHFERALASAPTEMQRAPILAKLAEVEVQRGNRNRAKRLYGKAISILPKWADPRAKRALITMQEDKVRGVAELEAAVASMPGGDPEHRRWREEWSRVLAKAYMDAGNWLGAAGILEAIASADPNSFENWISLGHAYAGLRSTQKALASYERARVIVEGKIHQARLLAPEAVAVLLPIRQNILGRIERLQGLP